MGSLADRIGTSRDRYGEVPASIYTSRHLADWHEGYEDGKNNQQRTSTRAHYRRGYDRGLTELLYGDVPASISYLPKRPALLGKRVNGGPWLALGSFPTQELARDAAAMNERFHNERCPYDVVEYSIDGERIS